MQTIEATWARVMKLWWSFMWRMLIAGSIFGFILSVMNPIMQLSQVTLMLANSTIGFGFSVWVFKELVGISYTDCRLAFIPLEDEGTNDT